MVKMFMRSRASLLVYLLVISLHVVRAWLQPERCSQEGKTKRATATNSESVPTVGNITEIAHNQNMMLKETYRNFTFINVPIKVDRLDDGSYTWDYYRYEPNRCTFHTHSPRLLSSVYCQEGVECKLGRTVPTSDSYTASEGYNWGVKVSTDFKFPVLQIGGEVSTGGTYDCTYSKSRTKTDNVECSVRT